MKIFNSYNLKARVFPAVIAVIPILILILTMANHELNKLINELFALQIIGNIGISLILIYLISQIARFIGKEVFENTYFKDEFEMPTTRFLLLDNSIFSNDLKIKLRKLILDKYRIELSSNYTKIEESEERKKIVEAVSLIRNDLRGNYMLLQHNTEYGFIRNLIGGSPLGLIISIFNIYYFSVIKHIPVLFNLSIITALFFMVLLLMSKIFILKYGKLYAKRLFQEFLTANKNYI